MAFASKMAACLPTCRPAPPMAFVAIPTATSGPPPDGPAKASTVYTSSRPTARSSAKFIFLKRAPTSASAALRKIVSSWPPASLSTPSTSTPKAPNCPDDGLSPVALHSHSWLCSTAHVAAGFSPPSALQAQWHSQRRVATAKENDYTSPHFRTQRSNQQTIWPDVGP